MFKVVLIIITSWSLLFTFRVLQIGGLDLTYKEEGVELFKPAREYLVKVVDQILPYPQSALLSGIILGSQERLPFYLKNELKSTSTIHIVVVSGQNLTILAGFIMSLAFLIGRKKAGIFTFLLIFFYSLLTGFQVPVIRAAIMVTFTFLALMVGKERTGWWVLLLTAGLMLLYNPHWLFNISFQLSFLATFGVVVVAPILLESLQKVPQILRQDLAVTLAAQALVLPVIVYNFHQLSLVGVLANIFVLWTIPLVMVAGFLSLGVGLVSTFLGQLVGLVPAVLLTYFIYIVDLFAKLPGAGLEIGETSVIFWLGYYLLIVAGVWYLAIRSNR
ncbi:MAG: internalization-related competence protein ComEC/Rec2 protein [Candidatus Daviesbacteria bacterium GW2011_GWA1_41_61]|uniref:Internalization-related competence protein ComEC/Rec2 protein n=1 Tax=Candidatus Daviesbacteria bacterium GW2011_GWA2_40_9 TaxID=1618424 RepID=A0A0G0U3H2_9BACT|nr:MAG: internalization-related competence protein ComEC/Rec2 protein [Candidatus Daviesbacteria bacterium GW2011_GWC1_40_9]KKR83604.1 MAG: internalization-related competence protein ComEC/Rec2 protein [Candidatus Daviesbacteria bacterium GW2011_GWA2_40_9]KKR92740.1 MAG: internalization-related competence protein ComEC/Rec2 protein [Candidatus Daviesbacteria bacterium GW2011_GWB1_41_15]KKS14500.1 MAG: internalization-related competence protein ComEC/Rec2 protein [Candidatus Daviesbacteria bacter